MIEGELKIVVNMVAQHCDLGSVVDSGAISANAEAMRLLGRHGLLSIETDGGRRVIAY
jgi:hypothetical protein